MIKFFFISFIFLLTNNCSFNTKSSFWTKDENLEKISKNTEVIFEIKKKINKELNPEFIIQTPLKLDKYKNINEHNDYGAYDLNFNFKRTSKYKFSRINNFDYFDPTIAFYKDSLIFFDKNGSILNFDNFSKLIWKKNYYTKLEKKLSPILNFSIKNKILIVTDNLSKYYAISIESGEILWSKNHNSIFISEIKIDRNQFYTIDSNGILNCFSLLDGSKIWEFDTDFELIKSQKKLSIVIDKEKIYFNNSKGDLYSLNKKNGNLIWLTPMRDPNEIFQTFLLKTSQLVIKDNNLFLSNNHNAFYSIDKNSGLINWSQDINSELKPIIVGNLIFTISTDGYLFIVDRKAGNIIRVTDIYAGIKKKKRDKILPTGFILDKEKIYLSLNNGKILRIDIKTGKTQSILKISRKKISEPFINKKYMYIIKNDEIIRLN